MTAAREPWGADTAEAWVPELPDDPASRRAASDPQPTCPDCGALLRRVPVEGWTVRTWRCDLHGDGLTPVWVRPVADAAPRQDWQRRGLLAARKPDNDEHSFGL